MFGLSIILIFFIELGYLNKSEFHDDFSKVGEYESSEPTSLATTSTMEGEHTLSPGAGEDGGEGLGERILRLAPEVTGQNRTGLGKGDVSTRYGLAGGVHVDVDEEVHHRGRDLPHDAAAVGVLIVVQLTDLVGGGRPDFSPLRVLIAGRYRL